MGHFESCSFKPETPSGIDLKGKRILLHCCCAPCSTAILEWMVEEGLRPGVFFSNSNITPFEEYAKRRDELARYAASLGLEVIDDEYDHSDWLEYVTSRVQGSPDGPERGPRCLACFEFRLLRAARYAASHGYDLLTTTLASSRWKDLSQVDQAGRLAVDSICCAPVSEGVPSGNTATLGRLRGGTGSEADGGAERSEAFPEGTAFLTEKGTIKVIWWNQNWRKGGLQERRNFLIKSRALYNQTWCGCEFSHRD